MKTTSSFFDTAFFGSFFDADEWEAVVAPQCGPSPGGRAALGRVCASVHALPKRNNRAETRGGALGRPGEATPGGESASQRGQT